MSETKKDRAAARKELPPGQGRRMNELTLENDTLTSKMFKKSGTDVKRESFPKRPDEGFYL